MGPKWERLPSGVLGVLIKALYPGMIDYKKDGVATGERGPARSWNHFTMVKDLTHGHLGMRLITEFWVSNLYTFTTYNTKSLDFIVLTPLSYMLNVCRIFSNSLKVKVKPRLLKRC